MQRFPEGVLPRDIVMLWRIHFGSFTNETVIPQYFECRYGDNSEESIQTLIKLGYVVKANAKDSLDLLTVDYLKKILEDYSLPKTGKNWIY